MKKIIVIILMSIAYISGYSQTTNATDPKTFDSSRVLSTVATGEAVNTEEGSWEKFLKKHINYDIAIFNEAPRGIYRVKIQFTVFKDGHLGDFVALTKFGYGMEKEVIKALKKSPAWKPAVQNGVVVNALRIQTVTFAVEQL